MARACVRTEVLLSAMFIGIVFLRGRRAVVSSYSSLLTYSKFLAKSILGSWSSLFQSIDTRQTVKVSRRAACLDPQRGSSEGAGGSDQEVSSQNYKCN